MFIRPLEHRLNCDYRLFAIRSACRHKAVACVRNIGSALAPHSAHSYITFLSRSAR